MLNIPVIESQQQNSIAISKDGGKARDQYVENISAFFIDIIKNLTEKHAAEKHEQKFELWASMELKNINKLEIESEDLKQKIKVNIFLINSILIWISKHLFNPFIFRNHKIIDNF